MFETFKNMYREFMSNVILDNNAHEVTYQAKVIERSDEITDFQTKLTARDETITALAFEKIKLLQDIEAKDNKIIELNNELLSSKTKHDDKNILLDSRLKDLMCYKKLFVISTSLWFISFITCKNFEIIKQFLL